MCVDVAVNCSEKCQQAVGGGREGASDQLIDRVHDDLETV